MKNSTVEFVIASWRPKTR